MKRESQHAEIPRVSFCKAYSGFMEQSTCVRSGHHCHDSCSLPCDDLRPCVLLRAFRCVEPEHYDVQQVCCDV